MSRRSTAQRYKKLTLKYDYLRIELEEYEEEFDERKKNFQVAYDAYLNELPPALKEVVRENTQADAPGPLAGSQQLRLPDAERDEIKNLYKEIAKKTHPDKHVNDASEVQAQNRQLFESAKQFYEKGAWVELQSIARDLGISSPPPSVTQIQYVQTSIERIRMRIKEIVETAAWKWYDYPEDQREGFMEQYFQVIVGDA